MQPRARQPRRLLDGLWVAASSAQFTIVLAVLLAFTFAIAAMLPQLPAGMDPLAASRWLSTTAARYGRFGTLLSSSGLFNVLAGPWMIALLAVTTFHLALRVANQARRLFAPSPDIPAAPQGLPFELVHLPVGVEVVHDRVRALASTLKPASALTENALGPRPRVDAYGEHHSWAAAGPLLTYLGPLVILLGLLWNTLGGWRVTDVMLIPGRTVQPPQATGLALSLIDASSVEEARPSVVSLTRGNETRHAWLSFARPTRWGPVWVTQRSSAPALLVRASASGSPLLLRALEGDAGSVDSLHLRFAENESEQAFTIPARNLAFRVVSYESLTDRGVEQPVFLVEGYQGTDPTPVLNELVQDSRTIALQGVTLALQREAYVVVDLAAMPASPLLLLGAFALLAGVVITAWGGLTRTWLNAAAERDGTLVAVRVAAPALGQVEVSRLAAGLATAPPGDARAASRSRTGLRYAGYIFAGALLLAGLSAIALRAGGLSSHRWQAWMLDLHLALALLGLGAFVAAAGQSLWFALRGDRLSDVADPMLRRPVQGLRGRAGDPGRAVTLAAFPLLTGAILAGSLWALFVFSAPLLPVAGEMWLLTAWLLAVAYLHATSSWRPLRTPAWLASVLVIAALAAAIAACLAAPSLLTW